MPESRAPSEWPPGHTYAVSCPALDSSPRLVRDFVAGVLRLRELGALVDDTVLCVSELVTNACVHAKGGGGAVVRLVVRRAGVRGTVFDGDREPPVLRDGYDAESGRGLWIVDAVTEGRWGVEPGPPGGVGAAVGPVESGGPVGPGGPVDGKGVWFELGWPVAVGRLGAGGGRAGEASEGRAGAGS